MPLRSNSLRNLTSSQSDVSLLTKQANDLFTTNKMGFVVSGSLARPAFEQAKKEEGLEYDYIVIPGQTGTRPRRCLRWEISSGLENKQKPDAPGNGKFFGGCSANEAFGSRPRTLRSNEVVLADPRNRKKTLSCTPTS